MFNDKLALIEANKRNHSAFSYLKRLTDLI
ncbi:hypothetical protein MOVI109754_08805 [Moritella viscosa]